MIKNTNCPHCSKSFKYNGPGAYTCDYCKGDFYANYNEGSVVTYLTGNINGPVLSGIITQPVNIGNITFENVSGNNIKIGHGSVNCPKCGSSNIFSVGTGRVCNECFFAWNVK